MIALDLDFAREVCGEAALYVDPRDPEAVLAAIETVMVDGARVQKIEVGRQRVSHLLDGREVARMYFDLMRTQIDD